MACKSLALRGRLRREHSCSRLWLDALVFLLAMMMAAPAFAQNRVLQNATLDDLTQELSLAPFTLVQPDAAGKVTPQSIEASGGTILNGAVSHHKMVNLGHSGVSTWLTIRVGNNSIEDGWILDFGRRSEGRMGYIEYARAYEMTFTPERQIAVREIDPATDKGAFRFQIPQGSQKYILVNVKAAAGKPAVLPLKLYSEQAYLRHVTDAFTPFTIHCFFLFLYVIFFTATAFTRRDKKIAIFGAFFLYELVIWSITEISGAVIGFGLFNLLIPCMMVGFTIFSIFLTKIFFNIEQGGFTEKYVLYGLAWLNVIATILSFLLPVNGGFTQLSLLYGAPVITFTVLSLMAGAQSVNRSTAGRLYFAGSLFPLAGLIVAVLGLLQITPYHPFLINCLWYSVSFQGFFMVVATYMKFTDEAHESFFKRKDANDVDFSKLQETKDKADHSRLLKVIEKERELLAEFRARENERVNEMSRAKEEADEANRAKSAFLAVVSHEIRTPMTGVMGMVRLLLDSSITKQQRDYVLAIQESSEAMMGLLNDILDFEKIQRGKMELENISFDLHRMIQGIITLMSGHAVEKGIQLSARIDDDLPKFVKGDPTRLRQVLLNLMGNAIKFTPKGSVTLIVKNMNEGEEGKEDKNDAEKNMIYFAIQDTGIGISPEAKKNLFSPFAQANSSINRKFGGSGLGLAISKGLIENMGSTVNISSKEGEGSTFFFALSLGRSAEVKTEKPLHQRLEEKRETVPLRILVVEDNQITQKVIIGFLDGVGHEILTASSAEEALEKINHNAFDLVFMDIEMGGMSGNEATKILREHRDRVKAAIPVIALTGNVAKEDKERYLADGMSGFLPKPIEADQLRSIVEEIAHKTFEREIRMPTQATGRVAKAPNDSNAQPERSEPMTQDKSIFNPDMLQSLKDTIGAKQLGDLLTELIVKMEEILQAMEVASQENDMGAMAARAHELKGMAGNFGLVEVSAIAAQAELKAKSADADSLPALVGTLPDASLRAQNALKDWTSH